MGLYSEMTSAFINRGNLDTKTLTQRTSCEDWSYGVTSQNDWKLGGEPGINPPLGPSEGSWLAITLIPEFQLPEL